MNDSYVTIARFTYESEMLVLLGKLESEGIRCFTANRTIISVRPLLSNALGGIQLKVHKDDLEEALEIMKGFEIGKKNKTQLDIIYKDIRYTRIRGFCPYCDENTMYTERLGLQKKLINSILFSKRKYYCNSCKKIWEQ